MPSTPRPVVVDTDFHELADDHEALVLLAAAHRSKSIELCAVTTVTGNTWSSISFQHARTALNALSLDGVPVYQGAVRPLLHRQDDFTHRSRLYGAAFGGAWGKSDLLLTDKRSLRTRELAAPEPHAAVIMAEVLRSASAPVTIAAIGPLTNIALALRLAPSIVENIERIVMMGGAFYVPGNVTPSAEFNWWFDPEAAAIVLESPIPIEILPLDTTDRIALDFSRYRRWSQDFSDHPFFEAFHRRKFEHVFAEDPDFRLPVWDALVGAYLLQPGIALERRSLWATVDCSDGPSYGRVVAFEDAEAFNLNVPDRPKADVILKMDESAFWSIYEQHVFDGAG